ncbi:MAG TPA: SGNH/GDSL hydrolase family protein [Epsilonproteobacteria bacterium]|nr:SGNH/GDSL hydrolase family protein [Campylobacterota bacterium]
MAQILALGDCNTSGVSEFQGKAYPEEFSKSIGKTVQNCGFTMSTTREMQFFFNENISEETEIIMIQYGLVDSWKTFKYAPYVLYYPDSPMRKIARKIVKKYKKIAKNIGLNKHLGVLPVVSPEEYKENIVHILKASSNHIVFLIDTIPNQDTSRNPAIVQYNKILEQLADKYSNVHYIDVYDDFIDKKEYYLDATHMNAEGYTVIARKLVSLYNKYDMKVC